MAGQSFEPIGGTKKRSSIMSLGLALKTGGRILSIHSRHAAGAVLDALESHPDAGTCHPTLVLRHLKRASASD